MTTELPPEMRAMNAAMDMVFNALNAAPQDQSQDGRLAPPAPAVATPQWTECPRSYCQSTMTCQYPSDCGSKLGVTQTSKRQMDIETAIMTIPGFDYITAWELTAAIQARLESVYEEKLNSKVDEAMKKLRAELDLIT